MDLSSLDDIPEETVLSGKSSEEKEMTRVDSGLGEWDSESSRKTSFSSQGRLSPDLGLEKTKVGISPPAVPCIARPALRRLWRSVGSQTIRGGDGVGLI